MRFIFITACIALAGCGPFNSSNTSEREKYWRKEISANLPANATKAEIEIFVLARGEKLHCYQNYAREDQCDITDNKSHGGTSKMPMKLAVIFNMKNERMTAYLFTTTPANPKQ